MMTAAPTEPMTAPIHIVIRPMMMTATAAHSAAVKITLLRTIR